MTHSVHASAVHVPVVHSAHPYSLARQASLEASAKHSLSTRLTSTEVAS
jgi:hypothetical protein